MTVAAGRWLALPRRWWWRIVWRMAAAIWCRRLDVTGLDNLPEGPVVYAANHASHADTVILQLLLGAGGRHRVLTAGADDYFFRNRVTGWVSSFIGVYPFPRSGEAGVLYSRRILATGWSVILYPQGTRSGGPFRPGVARVAGGNPVVPVTIDGTARILPKGAFMPRRGAVSVNFGAPLLRRPGEEPRAFAARLEAAVLAPGTARAA